jgi:hypothetical protein
VRLDSAEVPEWPSNFPTRDEAIAAALATMGPGEVFWTHQVTCALAYGRPCDCVVTMVPALTDAVQ